MKDLDLIKDILGISLPLDRIEENQQSYKDILEEIKKLRALDLSNEYPAVKYSTTFLTTRAVRHSLILDAYNKCSWI